MSESTPQTPEPEVFVYTNYREFLRDTYAFRKRTQPRFSHRFFSRLAGFSSPNFLKLVMDGQRNLTASSIARFARAFGMNRAQREFFTNLVSMNQADSEAERNEYYRRLSNARRYLEVKEIERDQYDYYSTWYVPPIRELVAVDGFSEDPAWIARHLAPPITPRQAASALALLARLKLTGRDERGRLIQSDPMLTTGPEVQSLAVRNFHRAMIRRAEEALDRFPLDQRQVSGLTVAMSRARADRIAKRLHEIRRTLFEAMCEIDPGDPHEAVFQLNLQLFPLTRLVSRPPAGSPAARSEEERSHEKK